MAVVPTPFTYDGDYQLAAIKIVFITHGKPDDKLLICPERKGLGFTSTYTQDSTGSRVIHYVSNTDLIPYIERVFTRLSFDEARPDFVQFDCPGYSSVVLKTQNVYGYLEILKEQIVSLQNRWPREVIGERKPVSTLQQQQQQQQQAQTQTETQAPVFTWPPLGANGLWAMYEDPVPAVVPAPASAPPTLRVTRSSARRV
jgi:hypothetical protein